MVTTTSLLDQVARDALRQPNTTFGPGISGATATRAIATIGVGPDHIEGERLVACVVESEDPRPPFYGYLVTSKRILAPGVSVPLAYLTGAQTQGSSAAEVWAGGSNSVIDTASAQWLVFFVQSVLRIPAASRPESGRAISRQALDHGPAALRVDGYTPSPIAEVAEAVLPRLAHEAAYDLVSRHLLHQRTVHRGRGMVDGWWLSPLPAADFEALAQRVFGSGAVSNGSAGSRILRIEVTKEKLRARGTAPTWVDILPPGTLELRVVNYNGFAAFLLHVTPASVATDGLYRHLVLEVLASHEERMLLVRTLVGWSLSVEEAVALPDERLAEIFKQLGVRPDLLQRAVPVDTESVAPPPTSMTPEYASPEGPSSVRAPTAPPVAAAAVPNEAETREFQLARERWAHARQSAQPAAMLSAAHGLREAAIRLNDPGFLTEVVNVFREVGERAPHTRAEARAAEGECYLAFAGGDVAHLTTALQRLQEALYLGAGRDFVDGRLYRVVAALAKARPEKGREYYSIYRSTFPNGDYMSEVEDALDAFRGEGFR